MTGFVKNNILSRAFFALIWIVVASSAYSGGGSGSTEIAAPPISTGKNIQSPSATTIAPGADPTNLCPTTIVEADCPDINGVRAVGANPANCPDSCYVRRAYTDNPDYTPDKAGFVPAVTNVAPPICPLGYFPGKQFTSPAGKMPEYIYVVKPPYNSPVTAAAYDALGGSANCRQGGAVGTSGGKASTKHGCNGLTASQACCVYGNALGAYVDTGEPYAAGPTGVLCGGDDVESNLKRSTLCDLGDEMIYLTAANYSWTNCWGSCAGGCIQGTAGSTDNYNYDYQTAECAPQEGYYPNGNMLDDALTCVRSKTEWKTLQQ